MQSTDQFLTTLYFTLLCLYPNFAETGRRAANNAGNFAWFGIWRGVQFSRNLVWIYSVMYVLTLLIVPAGWIQLCSATLLLVLFMFEMYRLFGWVQNYITPLFEKEPIFR